MTKKVFKLFFSRLKEEKWLNEMGKKGYLLKGLFDSRYSFEYNEGHTYSYSVQNIGASVKSDTASEYFSQLEKENILPILSTNGNWVIFCREDKEIPRSAEVLTKNGLVYRIRSLYLYGFSLVIALVCGYQFYAIDYLVGVGYKSGPVGLLELASETSFFSKILNGAKGIVNYLIELLNDYFSVWIKLLSNCENPDCTTVDHVCGSDAIRVLAVLLPLLVILIIIATFNLDEWFSYRRALKKVSKTSQAADLPQENENSQQTEEKDEEQNI